MTAAADFKTASEKLHHIDPTMWLGQLVWYGVSDVRIAHTALSQALITNGLNGFIPRLPSDVDVFRRVCTASQKRRVPTSDPDIYENYLIRDMPTTDTGVVCKVIVRETVQPDVLTYEAQVASVMFERATGDLSTHIVKDAGVVAKSIVADVEQGYRDERGTLNSYAVRELIRRVLTACSAVNVRGSGGGVYFVSHDHIDTISKLEGFAGQMPGTVLFHTLPLIDDGKQREMVRHAFESETVEEIERIVDEIARLEQTNTPVTAAKVESYANEMRRLKARTTEYMDLLQVSSDTARSSLDIFQRTIIKLMGMVQG
jgi:hypothetical protein